MSIFNIINSTDFDINIESNFVYNLYDKDEAVKDDNNISDRSSSEPKAYINLTLSSKTLYSDNIYSFIKNVNIENFLSLDDKSIENKKFYFNMLSKKEEYLRNINLDKDLSEINDFYEINSSTYNVSKEFLERSHKFKINKIYLDDFQRINSQNILINRKNKDINKSYNDLQSNVSKRNQSLTSENYIQINEDFNKYETKSRYSITNSNREYFLNVGYFIEKYELINQKKVYKSCKFFINNKLKELNALTISNNRVGTPGRLKTFLFNDQVTIRDKSVTYGKTYCYSVYPTFVMSQPTKNNYHTFDMFIVCDYPIVTDEILCKEFKRPKAPEHYKFHYDENHKKLNIKWFPPIEPQNDIKGFQIFKREKLEEPFTLIKQIEFTSENDDYVRNQNVSIEDIIKKDSILTEFDDNSYKPNKIQIYTICSIDAHGYTSNYGKQVAVLYDFLNKKCIIDQISKENAPLNMPNLLIDRKTKFYDSDNFIVDNLTFEKNASKISIYITPECFKIIDIENNGNFLLKENYKFSIFKLENGTSIINNINIENFKED